MSKTNTTNTRGIGATLKRVAQSIHTRFTAAVSFSDSSLADEIINDIAWQRSRDIQERSVHSVH